MINDREIKTTVLNRDSTTMEYSRGAYFDLIGELAGDDLAPLMMHLSSQRSLSPEEIVQQQRAKTKKVQGPRKQNAIGKVIRLYDFACR